jgi:hypothetical protein
MMLDLDESTRDGAGTLGMAALGTTMVAVGEDAEMMLGEGGSTLGTLAGSGGSGAKAGGTCGVAGVEVALLKISASC